MKVLLVGFKFGHHKNGSGYDEIAKYINNIKYLSANNVIYGNKKFGTIKRKINMIVTEFLSIILSYNKNVVHYIYSEQCIGFGPAFLRICGKKVVISVHLSYEQWSGTEGALRKIQRGMTIWGASSIICLSSSEASIFSEKIVGKNVVYIPHGYSFSNYYRSGPVSGKSMVCVGVNYRDFSVINKIANICDYDIQMVGVGKLLFNNNKIKINKHLSDDDYTELLKNCRVALLPLTFATANNAIFEYVDSCVYGLISKIDGVIDYVGDFSDKMLCNDSDDFVCKINEIYAMSDDNYTEHVNSVKKYFAEKFGWNSVAEKTRAVYSKNV